jgi:hypothetical protein
VVGVLAAGIAELRELEAAGGRLLVLCRRVVPVFALRALQCNNFAHLSILTDFADLLVPSRKPFILIANLPRQASCTRLFA